MPIVLFADSFFNNILNDLKKDERMRDMIRKLRVALKSKKRGEQGRGQIALTPSKQNRVSFRYHQDIRRELE